MRIVQKCTWKCLKSSLCTPPSISMYSAVNLKGALSKLMLKPGESAVLKLCTTISPKIKAQLGLRKRCTVQTKNTNERTNNQQITIQRATFDLLLTSQNEPEVNVYNMSLLVEQNIRIVPILHL